MDSPPPAPEKRSRRDLLAALASGFVAAMALLTSVYTVYLQRQQVRAAVWPRLDGREEYGENVYKLFVANRGAGAAMIERLRISLDGRPVRTWGEFLHRLPDDVTATIPGGSASIDKADNLACTIGAGGEKEFLEVDQAALLVLMELGRRLSVEVCYCSSLEECWNWEFDFAGFDQTRPVADCHPDPEPFHAATSDERAALIARVRAEVAARMDAGASDAARTLPRDGGR
ncbi:MAG TPA: hypothetical protein VGI39_25545 [Polyangiaceae bacterium]|jgi:hypothetical protein